MFKQYSAEGRFYLEGANRYITLSDDENGGTRYELDDGRSGILPLVSRIKLKEVMSNFFKMPVQPVFYGYGRSF